MSNSKQIGCFYCVFTGKIQGDDCPVCTVADAAKSADQPMGVSEVRATAVKSAGFAARKDAAPAPTATDQPVELPVVDDAKLLAVIDAAFDEFENAPCTPDNENMGINDMILHHLRPYLKERMKRCAATISTDPPMDCNWPFCGCDPKANDVLEALMESGYELVDPSRKGDVIMPQSTERESGEEWLRKPLDTMAINDSMPIEIDNRVPIGEVWFTDKNNRIVGKITGIGKTTDVEGGES